MARPLAGGDGLRHGRSRRAGRAGPRSRALQRFRRGPGVEALLHGLPSALTTSAGCTPAICVSLSSSDRTQSGSVSSLSSRMLAAAVVTIGVIRPGRPRVSALRRMARPGPGDRQDRVAAQMGVSVSAAVLRRRAKNAAATPIGALQPADRTGAGVRSSGNCRALVQICCRTTTSRPSAVCRRMCHQWPAGRR